MWPNLLACTFFSDKENYKEDKEWMKVLSKIENGRIEKLNEKSVIFRHGNIPSGFLQVRITYLIMSCKD